MPPRQIEDKSRSVVERMRNFVAEEYRNEAKYSANLVYLKRYELWLLNIPGF